MNAERLTSGTRRALAYVRVSNDEEEGSAMGGMAYYAIVFVLEMLFGVLASVIVMWFSRKREFKADEAGARLASTASMIGRVSSLV